LRYLDDTPDRDLSNGDTFRDGIPILVTDYQKEVILDSGDGGTFTVMDLNTVVSSETSAVKASGQGKRGINLRFIKRRLAHRLRRMGFSPATPWSPLLHQLVSTTKQPARTLAVLSLWPVWPVCGHFSEVQLHSLNSRTLSAIRMLFIGEVANDFISIHDQLAPKCDFIDVDAGLLALNTRSPAAATV
jgi:hypothetical protein